ncbi:MAG: hypothetical protein HYU36_12075 [Planctomycetes bacterium]|nr:hypothetical protein [Planctomycetota bacterium]
MQTHDSIRDLGIPVRSVNWVHLHAGRTAAGKPCLLATMGQQGDNLFVLRIDPETGELRQFVSPVPKSNFPTAVWMSRSGRLYVGAAYAGHLLALDPEGEQLEDLGAIHAGAATFPCRMEEDESGRIWIGSYGTADLTCYDPDRGEFIRYGRMDDVDMYNYAFVGEGGRLACLIRMTRPHVVVFDPATRVRKTVGPVTEKGKDTLSLSRAGDGRLYIESSLGNYRIEGDQAITVKGVPPAKPAPTLPDGSTFRFADAVEQVCRRLEIRSPGGETRCIDLGYEASGSEIFCVHAGPDGLIYGSSILPLHLFRYDPASGSVVDLGRCSKATGEAYSMANWEGKIYISSYPGAVLSVYDPARPYHFGDGPEDNPRDLGRIDEVSYRPRSTLAGPLGRVWVASVPDYGLWGGPLSWYDPATAEKRAYYRICGDGSCYTLAWLKDLGLLAVGTTIHGGSGTMPKVDQATLFLWDYRAEKKAWEGTLDRPVGTFNALLLGPGGRLYGTVRGSDPGSELFVFDPVARTWLRRIPLPGAALDLGLQMGGDGQIYGFTGACVYRLDPRTLAIEELVRSPGSFTVPGPILENEVVFASIHRLRAASIP